MKHCLSGSLLALLFLLTVGCSHREPAVLRQAEALMQPHPDSALALLQTCNRRQLSGRILARYALLYSMAQDKSLIEVRSDSLLSIAYDYYLRHPSDTLAPRAHLYMGRYYALLESTKRAGECLRQCIRLCETHKDYYTEYLALHSLSRCVWVGDPRLALSYAERAYTLCEEQCPPLISNKVNLLNAMGICYMLLEKMDSAQYCYEKSLTLSISDGDESAIGRSYHNIAAFYCEKGDYTSALHYAQEAYKMNVCNTPNLIMLLGELYLFVDSLEKANEMFSSILTTDDEGIRYIAFESLRNIAAQRNDLAQAMQYADSAQFYMEQQYYKKEKENAEYMKSSFQVLSEKESLSRKSQRNIFLIVIIIFVLLFTLLLFYIRMSYAKRKIKNEKEKRITSQRLQALEREKRMAEEALYREQIKGHEERLNMLRNFLLQKIDVMRKIKQSIRAKENLILSKRDWDEMEFVLNEADNNFINRLNERFPMLNQEDMQLCMLLRMDIDNKSIENLLFLSSQYVKQKQTILKKKMGLDDIPFSLRQYLEGF